MSFWRSLFRREQREQDLDEEIQSHLRMATRDQAEGGQGFEQAKESARREFGNVGLIKEVTREMWGWRSLERLSQDVRYAARILRRGPGFAVVAILSMALGIGANTAIFSLIDSVLLKSLPVRNPNELMTIGDPTRPNGLSEGPGRPDLLSYPFYERLRERNQVFTDIYATGKSEYLDVNVSNSAEDGKVQAPHGRFVSGNYFSVLGVTACIGRTFTEQETRVPGTAPVVVISYGFWERQFARNPGAIGRKLLVNGSPFTIIGVTPPEFFGDIVGTPTDIWFPMTMLAQANPGHDYLKNAEVSWLMLMGRLKPGVSQTRAAVAVNVLGHQIFSELYKSNRRLQQEKIQVASGAKGFSRLRKEFSMPLFILMGIVFLVLAICCANVANLQLARAVSRSREMGLRLAIGAGQSRLVRQLLTESLFLSLSGGAVGLLFAFWGCRLLLRLVGQEGQAPLQTHLDGGVLFFTAVVSVISGLIFGLVPALQSTRVDLVSSLKENKFGQSEGFAQDFGKALIVLQIVFSLVLLVSAGLFIRTLQNLRNVDVGYARKGLLLVEVDSKTAGYQDAQVNQVTTDLLRRLQQIPGVQAVTVSENGLFSGTDSETRTEVEGFTPHSDEDTSNRSDRVGPNYFEIVGTPILLGRGIEARDVENAPRVAVLNEKMSRFYFLNRNPIGRHLFDGSGKDRVGITIVGVVRDTKERELRLPPARRYYTSYSQHAKDDPIEDINFEIRTKAPSAGIAESIRRAIKSFNPKLPIVAVKSADALIDDHLVEERLIAKLSGFFGALALSLAAIGLYGVMSYITARRTMEIGVRMALGAARGSVIAMVLNQTFRLLLIGLVAGGIISLLAARLLARILFEVPPFDPLTLLAAAGVIAIAAALATYLPAWRASRIDPMIALRYE